MWADPATLPRKIQRDLELNKRAPARFHFTEGENARRLVIMEQFEAIVRDGWWTAEEVYELKPMEERVLRLILRVKLLLEDFRGDLTAASIAHFLRCKDPRAVQLAIRRLEAVQLIEVDRVRRAISEIHVSNFLYEPARPQRRRKGQAAGMPAERARATPQKQRETHHREISACAERFAAERALRAAQLVAETNKNSEHISGKQSSERTPYPLFAAAPAAAAGGPPSTPDDNGTEERKRLGGYAASPEPSYGNDNDRTATSQGIQRHSRALMLMVPLQILGPPE